MRFSMRWLVVLTAVLASLMRQPAGAAEEAPKSTWQTACSSEASSPACRISQTIVDGKGRKIVRFEVAQGKAGPYLEANAPLKLYIPFGVALQIDDGEKRPMQLVDCDKTGCRAVITIDKLLIKSLAAGKAIKLYFMDSASAKQIAVGGSLIGFATAVRSVLEPKPEG